MREENVLRLTVHSRIETNSDTATTLLYLKLKNLKEFEFCVPYNRMWLGEVDENLLAAHTMNLNAFWISPKLLKAYDCEEISNKMKISADSTKLGVFVTSALQTIIDLPHSLTRTSKNGLLPALILAKNMKLKCTELLKARVQYLNAYHVAFRTYPRLNAYEPKPIICETFELYSKHSVTQFKAKEVTLKTYAAVGVLS